MSHSVDCVLQETNHKSCDSMYYGSLLNYSTVNDITTNLQVEQGCGGVVVCIKEDVDCEMLVAKSNTYGSTNGCCP